MKYSKKVAKRLTDYIQKTEFPMIEEFAVQEGVTSRTIRYWRKEHDDIKQALKMLKEKAKVHIVKTGLRTNNVALDIFMLKVNYGMVETNRNEITGAGGGPIGFNSVNDLSDEQLAAIAAGSSQGAAGETKS